MEKIWVKWSPVCTGQGQLCRSSLDPTGITVNWKQLFPLGLKRFLSWKESLCTTVLSSPGCRRNQCMWCTSLPRGPMFCHERQLCGTHNAGNTQTPKQLSLGIFLNQHWLAYVSSSCRDLHLCIAYCFSECYLDLKKYKQDIWKRKTVSYLHP